MYRVLVADDEPIERMVVTKKLQAYFPGQLDIIQAVNGREAVKLFEEQKCHIGLLDIEMPGINGLKAAEKIRENNKQCSIIFLTAFDDFNYAKKAISVRALDYLLKPTDDKELQAVMEEAIRLADCQSTKKTTETVRKKHSPPAETIEPIAEDAPENIRLNAVAEKIRSYIEDHYQEDISLQELAAFMEYSDAYFCKIFKQCFDKSFIMYLSEFRMEKAKALLEDTMINIKDISICVGYRDSNYFAKVFKRMIGVTPSEYRLHILQNEMQVNKI